MTDKEMLDLRRVAGDRREDDSSASRTHKPTRPTQGGARRASIRAVEPEELRERPETANDGRRPGRGGSPAPWPGPPVRSPAPVEEVPPTRCQACAACGWRSRRQPPPLPGRPALVRHLEWHERPASPRRIEERAPTRRAPPVAPAASARRRPPRAVHPGAVHSGSPDRRPSRLGPRRPTCRPCHRSKVPSPGSAAAGATGKPIPPPPGMQGRGTGALLDLWRARSLPSGRRVDGPPTGTPVGGRGPGGRWLRRTSCGRRRCRRPQCGPGGGPEAVAPVAAVARSSAAPSQGKVVGAGAARSSSRWIPT